MSRSSSSRSRRPERVKSPKGAFSSARSLHVRSTLRAAEGGTESPRSYKSVR